MILYIMQVNIALALFAILYRYLLSSDTLFNLRRGFLLAIIFVSFTFQFMPAIADINFFQQESGYSITSTLPESSGVLVAPLSVGYEFSMVNIIAAIWIIGSVILTLRFVFGFIAIMQIKYRGKRITINSTNIILINSELTPFSFYKWIFIPSSQLEKSNLQDVLIHENTHIKEQHTIDVIISELLVIAFWFNPAVWFIRYAIRENLEFLADKNVLDCGHNRKEYQYNLLKLSCQPSVNNIVNYFNVSQLKNRIIMMNREKTSKKAVLKYMLLLPALMLLSLTNNAQTKGKEQIKIRGINSAISPLIIIDNVESEKGVLDKLDPNDIESVSVLKDSTAFRLYGEKGKDGVMIIVTKASVADGVKVVGYRDKKDFNVTIDYDEMPKSNIKVVGSGKYKDADTTKYTLKTRGNSEKALFLVDGKESTQEEVSKLNPDKIASVTVLKDEKATSIYGDKAKDGVILILLKEL